MHQVQYCVASPGGSSHISIKLLKSEHADSVKNQPVNIRRKM